eukprot:GFUD01137704.1.p1 GENE.GFUD01137704.1~~GFUD01137704.1.p1  ORF type:complete len:486 (-),score=116.16 GFUD01137704.1:110-1567(-)
MAPKKKLGASKIECLQFEDRMMFEEELEILRTVIEDQQTHIEALEEDKQEVTTLKIEIHEKKEKFKALQVNSDDNIFKFDEELKAMKTITYNQNKEIEALKIKAGDDRTKHEISVQNMEKVIEKERQKVANLESKIEEERKKFTKKDGDLKALRIVTDIQTKRIRTLDSEASKDLQKHEATVQNLSKVIEKDKKEAKHWESKIKEEKMRVKESRDKHKHLVDQLRDKIECPVCLEVPRFGPVPVCPNGHLVCLNCKSELCPTCRVRMGPGKSLLAGTVIENIDHRCMFNDCEEYFPLDKIDAHAKVCDHRTVKCPHCSCAEKVALSKLLDHLKLGCSYDEAPIKVARSLQLQREFRPITDGYTLGNKDTEKKNLSWKLLRTYVFDDVIFSIFPLKQNGHFYFPFVMFSSGAECSKYEIEVTIEDNHLASRNSGVRFKYAGVPSSIDEDKETRKHLGLTVDSSGMDQIFKKSGMNGFSLSFSIKKR